MTEQQAVVLKVLEMRTPYSTFHYAIAIRSSLVYVLIPDSVWPD